jgi:hypothetical protein
MSKIPGLISPKPPAPSGKLTFTVDSALLKELGERLVGKAHIALAELIKNSYDADATVCEITIKNNSIEISDNGHGMNYDDFKRFWMRVGTTHKQREQFSKGLARPLTGSKGVGRLSVQFLAEAVHIESTPKNGDASIIVDVDWNAAVQREFLTQAEASYKIKKISTKYAANSPNGFRIILSGLTQEWDAKSLSALAKEIWTLRPPFDGFAGKGIGDKSKDFQIDLKSDDIAGQTAFEEQIAAVDDIWIAKIEGLIENGHITKSQLVTITFKDGEQIVRKFDIPGCSIDSASWEIRIYNLSGHLGANVKVQDARDYFSDFGGVHVYDGPFRLPYYGIQQDWLGLEFDHSHRKVKSRLLPSELHVDRALNDLPSQGRILGVVRIDTGEEMRAAHRAKKKHDFLKIQVTRDRLQINQAYEHLHLAVRRSIDFYAVCSMGKRLRSAQLELPKESSLQAVTRVERSLDSFREAIPAAAYYELKNEISTFVDSTKREQSYKDSLVSLLGPLAAAGMSAIALEHETTRQLSVLDGIATKLSRSLVTESNASHFGVEIKDWIAHFRQLRRVFEPLSNEEDREEVRVMKADKVIALVRNSLKPFLAGINMDRNFAENVYLPLATLAEWQGLFQNVITNALNAMLDSKERKILFSTGRGPGRKAWVRISDTGIGIDVSRSHEFFEPFQRSGEISEQRKSMGLGGHGLGLTIVRMIAENRNCRVAFVEPEDGFKTTFELSWSIKND